MLKQQSGGERVRQALLVLCQFRRSEIRSTLKESLVNGIPGAGKLSD